MFSNKINQMMVQNLHNAGWDTETTISSFVSQLLMNPEVSKAEVARQYWMLMSIAISQAEN